MYLGLGIYCLGMLSGCAVMRDVVQRSISMDVCALDPYIFVRNSKDIRCALSHRVSTFHKI